MAEVEVKGENTVLASDVAACQKKNYQKVIYPLWGFLA
jgi:hypothetical protein